MLKQIMRKEKLVVMPLLAVLLALTSCEKRYVFTMSEDPGYVTDPIVSLRALDGDRWIEAVPYARERTFDFEFHNLDDLDNVVLDIKLKKPWASMVSPSQERWSANLTGTLSIKVNDGVDDVIYKVNGRRYPFISELKAVLGEETISLDLDGMDFSGSFRSAMLASQLTKISIKVVPGENVEVLTQPSNLENLDFTDGKGVEVQVLDRTTQRKKTFTVHTYPSDVAEFDDNWNEVTKSWAEQYNVDFGNVRMYRTGALLDRSGNTAYAFTIPAGFVNLKVVEKNHTGGAASSKISAVVRGNRDFCFFLPQQGPKVWHTDGSTDNANYEYYSPQAYGPEEGSGASKVLRNDGFSGTLKAYAPALGLKDGKAAIRPASAEGGVLYSCEDISGTSLVPWEVESAFGGYFLICKDGQSLIPAEGERFYGIYNSEWRKFGEQMTCYLTPSWKVEPIIVHDRLRTGRIGIGCTEEGSLVVLIVEKIVNTHNQGQDVDKGSNGSLSDKRGVSLYELARVMSDLGCSEAMTVEDFNWSYIILQDGSERGKDLFRTNSRWYIDSTSENYGRMKAESSEAENLVVACFR